MSNLGKNTEIDHKVKDEFESSLSNLMSLLNAQKDNNSRNSTHEANDNNNEDSSVNMNAPENGPNSKKSRPSSTILGSNSTAGNNSLDAGLDLANASVSQISEKLLSGITNSQNNGVSSNNIVSANSLHEFISASNTASSSHNQVTSSCLSTVPLPTIPNNSSSNVSMNLNDIIKIGGASHKNNTSRTPILSVEKQREEERRVRRQIANSNERRRMQSINNGFMSLRTIIPDGHDEKLSKAAVLQQTANYVRQLEKDKLDLIKEIDRLKRAMQHRGEPGEPDSSGME